MNPYLAYSKQREQQGWSRIDQLLALYDGAIKCLDRAVKHLKAKEVNRAMTHLSQAQLIVMGLATVAPVDRNKDLGENLLRLYEFCVHRIAQVTEEATEDAIKILQTLRQGYEAVRPQVAEMERSGKLRPAESLRMIQGVA